MIRFVVTGAPRSGTMWTARALSAAGLDCTHETICARWGPNYDDDTVWRHSAQFGESSPQAGAFVEQMSDAGVIVVRVMRHPLAVVASILARGIIGVSRPIEHFYRHHCPEPWERWDTWDDLPDVVLAFWIAWNKHIDTHADLRWKSPASTHDVTQLAKLLDHDIDSSKIADVPPSNVGNHVTRLGVHSFTPELWAEAIELWESA